MALILAMYQVSAISATVDWTFDITNPGVTINPTDSVSIIGEINNLSSSTDTLVINEPCELCVVPASYFIGASDATPFNVFNVEAVNIETTLAGLSLNPGESFSFIFYTLSPLSGSVPIGDYEFSINQLSIAGYSGFKSAGSVNVSVIPLPSAFFLMFSGIACLGSLFWRKQLSSKVLTH